VPPLRGIRVLDCTRYLPFSFGSQLLLNLGADVVKVEPPEGEAGRAMTTTFAAANGGKRSVTINLANPEGAQLFLDLVDGADVVVESFRPGVMAKFGLSPSSLLQRKPSLVICSATGYGQTGPYAERPGHDLNYLAVAGGVLPRADGAPILPAFPVADMSSGVFVALSVTAAVLAATRTGHGQHIDLGMSDVALSMNLFSVASGLGGSAGLPWPHISRGECPCYGVWQTADGRWISLGNIEPKFWHAFLEEIGLSGFRDDGLAVGERAAEVRVAIGAVIATESFEHWDARFAGADICFSPVNDMPGVRTDPHVRERGMLLQHGDDWTVAFPARFSGFDTMTSARVPRCGEDNEREFALVGRDEGELARLRRTGAI
jgi:crotonobetainyl-CoA:carnitine CoA-transferase CaiB-like acyl-CoA transferase